MKTKLTLGIIALAFLSSCQKDKAVAETKIETNIVQTENTLELQTFSELPELKECFIYIAKDKAAFDKKEFIFADDYGNNAFIKIKDEMLTIPLEEGDFDPSESERKIIFENGEIEMEIEPIEENDSEEELIFKGHFEIEKDGNKYETSIYGKSSC